METKEEVKLSKHIKAAINSLQLQIDKFYTAKGKQAEKRDDAIEAIQQLDASISALSEQISKLKG